jgi:hypothetical protein
MKVNFQHKSSLHSNAAISGAGGSGKIILKLFTGVLPLSTAMIVLIDLRALIFLSLSL